jgi:hypothetical protein
MDDDGIVRIVKPDLPPISVDMRRKLIDFVKENYPRARIHATDAGPFGLRMSVGLGLGGISDYQVDRYNTSYDEFIEEYEAQFADLHSLMSRALRIGEIRVELKNTSAVTASNLRFSVSCDEAALMFGSRSEMEAFGGSLMRIEAPDPPREHLTPLPYFHNPSNFREPRRDPTAFYWLNRPDGGKRCALVCDEFRAQHTRVEPFYLMNQSNTESTIKLNLSATNLPSPITLSARVLFTEGEVAWSDPAVLRRLPSWMRKVISEKL